MSSPEGAWRSENGNRVLNMRASRVVQDQRFALNTPADVPAKTWF